MKRTVIVFIIVILIILGAVFYGRNQVYKAHGKNLGKVTIQVEKGEGISEVADKLEKEELISGKIYFYYYIEVNKLLSKILPGEYVLSGSQTIPEIATILTKEKEDFVKITFPEGWTAKQMAKRLTENGLDGNGFLKIVNAPEEIVSQFQILEENKVKNLEGYLFPDTYFFAKDIDAKGIVTKIIRNFEGKISPETRQEIIQQKKSLGEILIMASIIEREVTNFEDREIVSGIFWTRIKIGQPLQSCATLAFIIGENKKQYTYADTQIVSPYNTYLNRDLPPGPIANPGIAAIDAAIHPKDSQFNYFLSDPETGKTIFSKTLDEHNANKVKYGL